MMVIAAPEARPDRRKAAWPADRHGWWLPLQLSVGSDMLLRWLISKTRCKTMLFGCRSENSALRFFQTIPRQFYTL